MSDSDLRCLDLVAVQNFWVVLSEAGRYTYRHTSGLLFNETWLFVPTQEAVGAWPVKFSVSYDKPLKHAELMKPYGREATARARSDVSAVQLHLARLG